MDILVPIPMKNAAKCDTQCELQNSASHQIFERNWRLLAGMFVSVCLESNQSQIRMRLRSFGSSFVKCEGVRIGCLSHCNEVVTLVRDLVYRATRSSLN